MGQVPVAFISHGAPISLDDQDWLSALHMWGKGLSSVKEILVLSAHWVTDRLAVGPASLSPLLYDFYGFPDRFYQVSYPAPVSTFLLEKISGLAGLGPISVEKARGLDHGMWVPLKGLFPKADIPVLGLSIPGLSPEYLYEFGKRLSPLRNEGVLILCSGGMTHNLGDLNFQEAAPPESWAVEFDQWVVGRLLARDVRSLLKFDTQAPFSHKAHPSTEHFAPLFISLGAGEGSLSEISFPVSGFRWGTLSMRSVQFG